MKKFEIVRHQGEQTYIRQPASYIDVRVLAANSNENHPVPASGAFVVFSADGDFWAKPNSTATIPVADVTDGTGSELNPAAWNLTNVTGINLIASSARKVTLSFYSA